MRGQVWDSVEMAFQHLAINVFSMMLHAGIETFVNFFL